MDKELRRLCGLYEEKGDEELLRLFERREDLTELAEEALVLVMKERNLEPEGEEDSDLKEQIEESEGEEQGLNEGEEPLWFFSDGLEASKCLGLLEDAGIACRMVHPRQAGTAMRHGQSTGLQLVVRGVDAERARKVLRAGAGLFPAAEFEDPYAAHSGWEVLGIFERADALVVAQTLGQNGFSFAWEDGMEDLGSEVSHISMSVKSARAKKAMALVEKVLEELPERED